MRSLRGSDAGSAGARDPARPGAIMPLATLETMGAVPRPSQEPEAREQIVVRTTKNLPGVELWSAKQSTRLMSVYHYTYTFCAVDRMNGRQSWRYRGQGYHMSASSLMAIEPGELHVTEEIEQPTDYRVLFVRASAWKGALEAQTRVPTLHLPAGQLDDADIVSRFKRVCDAVESAWADPVEQEELLGGFLRAVACRTGDRPPLPPERPCALAVEKARRYLEEHHPFPISLADVASAVGTGKFHLAHSFSRIVRMSMFEYLRHFRASRALDLLRAGGRPIDVAAAVGFVDQSHLIRAFRDQFGFTPGHFVRAIVRSKRSPNRYPVIGL
jgi:AraC-like DNA-binding protein